jgi:photosystem II stability/assembly factor-like uncharacterized protein
MAFANDQVGWAVGESGMIQYTEDGGATWLIQESPTRKLLYDVAAIDAKQAWAVGAGGKLLRTDDGGMTWNEKSSEVAETLRAVHFADAKHGWAVGARGTIISTNNGCAVKRSNATPRARLQQISLAIYPNLITASYSLDLAMLL